MLYGDDFDSSIGVKPECEQFVGKRGDMILWHAFTCHTGSDNVSNTPRLAVFSRWHRPEAKRASPIKGHDNSGISRAKEDIGEYMTNADYEPLDSPARNEPWYEVPKNMWKYWSAEMQEAAAGVSAADDAEVAGAAPVARL